MSDDHSTVSRSGSTIADFFVICGLGPNDGLEIEKFASASQSAPPLERSYVARILARYPDQRAEREFHDDVLALCMPRGLRFCTQKDLPSEPSFHNFANIREDGSRVDGCALTFFEEVRDGSLCEAMHRLQTTHVRQITCQEETGRNEKMRESGYSSQPGAATGGVHTLPRRGRAYRPKRTSYYDSANDALFVSKCICIVCRLPMVHSLEAVLRFLYVTVRSEQPPPLPLESYLFWLLHELPLPPPASTLKVAFGSLDIVCQRPGCDELPFFDYRLSELFLLLTIDKLLKIYTCVLLEHQILFCSKSLQRLMRAAESLTCLAFPFRWAHVYVPILPYAQSLFLEAPLPFIMGLCYDEHIAGGVYQSTICVVDLDTGRVEFPEDLPMLPDRAELAAELTAVIARFDHLLGGDQQHSESDTVVTRRHHTPSAEEWKRMSRSFDDDFSSTNNNTISNNNGTDTHSSAENGKTPGMTLNLAQFSDSDAVNRVQEIARRAGVNVAWDSVQPAESAKLKESTTCKRYFHEMRFNNAVREVFLNRFVLMFHSYEHFVIGGTGFANRDDYICSRDSLHNFDKASFLSDQPNSHLNFLSAFLETQMFASFVDSKILSQWEEPDQNLVLFDRRIAELKAKNGAAMVRTPTSESGHCFQLTEQLILSREQTSDLIVAPPHALEQATSHNTAAHVPGCFPLLDGRLFAASPNESPWRLKSGVNLRNKQKERAKAPRPTSTYGVPSTALDLTTAEIAKTNWSFVEQLLREAKAKTKRMLVEKMGREAIELGHCDISITGVEENTLVASFCDLLERVWAHGLQKKQGKSALWTHLLAHEELEKMGDSSQQLHSGAHPYISADGGQSQTASGVVSYLSGLQSDLGGSEAAPWSASLLRAASFIRDKISAQQQQEQMPPPAMRASTNNVMTSSVQQDNKQRQRGSSIGGGVRRFGSTLALLSTSYANESTNTAADSNARQPSNQPQPKPAGFWTNSLPRKAFRSRDLTPSSWTGQHDPTGTPYHAPAGVSQYAGVPESPRKQRSLSRPRSPDARNQLPPLPTHIAHDLKNVLRMTEIKTDIGYARAFVRLALERKLLHKHLRTLLGNHDLLRQMYKRYAFLRCEDEKTQLLYHILSLNAAEFRCFTNTFIRTKITYHVLLVPGGGRFTMTNTNATIWIRLAGSLGQTVALHLPKNTLQFTFEHRNLGVLSTCRIGHEHNAQLNQPGAIATLPKWFLDEIVVRNEITGHECRFPCGRWFGRAVDDGSLERLLVAKQMPTVEVDVNGDATGSLQRASKQRTRSPNTLRRTENNPKLRIAECQQRLGECVNNIVKHFYRIQHSNQQTSIPGTDKDHRALLTRLLCDKEDGLVHWLQEAFLIGLRSSSRMFGGGQRFPWDYVEKVCAWWFDLLRGDSNSVGITRDQKILIHHACKLVVKIGVNSALGKEGKFQAFIVLAIRDHVLSGLLTLMAWTPVTGEMYDEQSFVRTPQYLGFLTKLLCELNEFSFDLEQSLTWGVDG